MSHNFGDHSWLRREAVDSNRAQDVSLLALGGGDV